MTDNTSQQRCLACERDSTITPLIAIQYRDSQYWICPQHLPVLIHDPTQLIGKLPGATDLKPAEHRD